MKLRHLPSLGSPLVLGLGAALLSLACSGDSTDGEAESASDDTEERESADEAFEDAQANFAEEGLDLVSLAASSAGESEEATGDDEDSDGDADDESEGAETSEDRETESTLTVRDVEALEEDEEAIARIAETVPDDRDLQRVTLAERETEQQTIEELVMFGDADEQQQLRDAHEIEEQDEEEPRLYQLADDARPRDLFTNDELGFAASEPSDEDPPARQGSDDDDDEPVLVVATELTNGGGNSAMIGELDLSSGEQPSVVRYVANDDLPLFADADFDGDVEDELERGEPVLVFDTLPEVVDGNVMVQIQVATRSPHAVGWVPLTWLYDKSVGTNTNTLDFRATYGLFSKQVAGFIEKAFYEPCDPYPRFPHARVFTSVPEFNPNVLPDDANYRCGEYPVGETISSTRKRITTVEFDTPEYHHDGVLFDINIESIPLEVPVDMLRIDWQTRGDDYEIRDLSTAWGHDADVDKEERRLYSRYPNHEHGAIEDLDQKVRIHDTDFWFNVSYEPPSGVTQDADAYLNTCFYMPGGTLRGGPFPVSVKLTTKSIKTRHSYIDGMDLGTMEFSRFKVCATATIKQRAESSGDNDGVIDQLAPNVMPGPLHIDFVRGRILDLELDYVQGIELFGSFDPLHDEIISSLLGMLNNVLKDGIEFSIFGKEVVDFDGLGPLLWESYMKGALEAELLNQLDRVSARLNAALPDPENALRRACDLIMPDSYKEVSSPYYPLYQQCQEAAQAAEVDPLVVPPNTDSVCYQPNNYARVNDGKNWWSVDDTEELFYLSDEPGDYILMDRPFWVNGCGLTADVETTMMSDWWPLLNCMADVIEHDVNFGQTPASISSHLQTQCLKPAVKMMCDLYGEGDDMVDMWTAASPVDVGVPSAFNFCAWYESLDAEPCTPSTCLILE